jgi:hypothetical protein
MQKELVVVGTGLDKEKMLFSNAMTRFSTAETKGRI